MISVSRTPPKKDRERGREGEEGEGGGREGQGRKKEGRNGISENGSICTGECTIMVERPNFWNTHYDLESAQFRSVQEQIKQHYSPNIAKNFGHEQSQKEQTYASSKSEKLG